MECLRWKSESTIYDNPQYLAYEDQLRSYLAIIFLITKQTSYAFTYLTFDNHHVDLKLVYLKQNKIVSHK